VLILLVSERQPIIDLIIGQTTTFELIDVKKEGGTYRITYKIMPTYSISHFNLEYRNHEFLRGIVVVRPVSLPFVLC